MNHIQFSNNMLKKSTNPATLSKEIGYLTNSNCTIAGLVLVGS